MHGHTNIRFWDSLFSFHQLSVIPVSNGLQSSSVNIVSNTSDTILLVIYYYVYASFIKGFM